MAYVYDLNAILVHAMPSKNDAATITAFTKTLTTPAARGYKPTLNVTDSRCSKMVETSNPKKWTFLLSLLTTTAPTLPNVPLPHSRNTSLRSWPLSTGTALYNCGMIFAPLHQVKLTLNLLCFSPHDPSKSANKEVHVPYEFNKTLIAPLGTKGLIYNNPAVRASWAPHGTDAFYVGPAPKHYWCLRFYMPTI